MNEQTAGLYSEWKPRYSVVSCIAWHVNAVANFLFNFKNLDVAYMLKQPTSLQYYFISCVHNSAVLTGHCLYVYSGSYCIVL